MPTHTRYLLQSDQAPADAPADTSPSNSNGVDRATVIASAIAGIGFILLIALLIAYCVIRRRQLPLYENVSRRKSVSGHSSAILPNSGGGTSESKLRPDGEP